MNAPVKTPKAQALPEWRLDDLYSGRSDPKIEADLAKAKAANDALVALHPRHDQLRSDLDRVLRQRNTLLKQAAGGSRFDESAAFTLEVWHAKLIELGEALASARRDLVKKLQPRLRAILATAGRTSLQWT